VAQSPQARTSCDVPELVNGNATYNGLVCQGVTALAQERAIDAVLFFEEAMGIRLSELPNFKLYPRLALAYWKSGDKERANDTLQKGRLALLVLVGVYHCLEHDRGFSLADRYGDAVNEPFAEELARRMCGAAYEYIYVRESLRSFARDAPLVENYLRIEAIIRGN